MPLLDTAPEAGHNAADMEKGKKVRADLHLVLRGLAATAAKAQAMILAGQVWQGERRVGKPGDRVEENAELCIRPLHSGYISRGGHKLAGALDHFGIRPAGKVCLDIGASTGGFTDCLIRRGAALVMALDVGRSQLAAELRRHPRVLLLERTNVRFLRSEELPEPPELVVADLAFISLCAVLPAVAAACRPSASARPGMEALLLVKPQFELPRNCVEKGGIVRDPERHRQAVERVRLCAESLGMETRGWVESCLPGAQGNREFFLYTGDRSPGSGELRSPGLAAGRPSPAG